MFQYLCLHPQVFAPLEKEPNYFCEDFPGVRGPKSLNEYLDLFASASDVETAIGDGSVGYMYSAAALPAIREFDPDARIIIMIRNPVEMVYSFHSQMLFTLNEDQADFSKAWALQEKRAAGKSLPKDCLEPQFLQYESMGRMSVGIKRALDTFPAEQVKVLLIDDIKDSPQQVFNDVVSFLGLERITLDEFPVVNANKTNKSAAVAMYTQRGLPPLIKKPLRALKKLLGLGNVSISGKLDRLNKTEVARKPLSDDMRRKLGEIFADEIADLEDLTGRDLQHWRDKNAASS